LLRGNKLHKNGDGERDTTGTCGDRAKAFLTSSIPDLQLTTLVLQLHGANLEIDSDSCDETGVESIVSETKEQAALADTTVADEQQLD